MQSGQAVEAVEMEGALKGLKASGAQGGSAGAVCWKWKERQPNSPHQAPTDLTAGAISYRRQASHFVLPSVKHLHPTILELQTRLFQVPNPTTSGPLRTNHEPNPPPPAVPLHDPPTGAAALSLDGRIADSLAYSGLGPSPLPSTAVALSPSPHSHTTASQLYLT
ncbi:hypothetical protein CKAH01_00607 [Colletotrichum kahawae]|uniref:Uncharacterized protein n=1 Tax=Colletotrichum kahawae TaxID=34407 RepID=A0AAE0DAY9_COLKA|nr:hypothetical protein CKAH01_00607 [Colletotrichum kahawae]